jgi:YesN/AraC family two-component response regulator
LTALRDNRAEKQPLLIPTSNNNVYNNNNNNNILLLDDELDILALIKELLKRNGFNNVSAFTDPFLALEYFKMNSNNHSLILSDIRMPGMNGFEFANKVRKINYFVKILLMSGLEVSEFEFLNIKSTLKVDGFIQKPVSVAQLIEKIQKVY